ncbi:MAG: hypothetical protein KatS3mg042_1088 [Rhodothermaceae bacterium]|nr:MAG: hypothetical protein KatS3mg042_1088 [Rhodothermaceae bacterium]
MNNQIAGRVAVWMVGLSLLLGTGSMVRAQAWTLAPGAGYLKVFYGKVTAAEQYTFDGRRTDFIDGLPGDTFRDRSLYLYGEVGVKEHVSLFFSLPYKRVFIRDHAFRFRTFGLGTVTVGGRIGLLPLLGWRSSPHALALNVALGLPTGYTRNYAPSVDPGQVDVAAVLSYGISFYPFPGYAQVGIGGRLRTPLYVFSHRIDCQPGRDVHCIEDRRVDYGDELLWSAELGGTLFGGGVLVQVLANGRWSWQPPRVGFSALNPIPLRQRYVKVGGGMTLFPFRWLGSSRLGAVGWSLQYFITPYGRNTIRSRDLFAGISYRWGS